MKILSITRIRQNYSSPLLATKPKIDRDFNSAKNILLLGLERALKPLKTEPLPIRHVQSMNKEVHSSMNG